MTSLVVLFVMTGERSGPSLKNVRSLKAPSTPIQSLCFSPVALKIASCDTSGRLTLWELPEDRPWDEWGGRDQKIKCVAFSPNRDLMAWGTWDGRIVFWNLKTRTRTRTLHDREASISVLEFSPDGKTLVSADVTGSLSLWNVASGQLRKVHETRFRMITALDVSSDSRSVTAAGLDSQGGRLLVFDLPSGEPRQQLRLAPRSIVRTLEFLPGDDQVLWLDVGYQQLRRWALNQEESEVLLDEHHRLTSFALSPDGTTVAVGTSEGEVNLRAWKTLQVTHRFKKQPNPIQALDFSHDGRFVAVGGLLSGLIVWNP
ncbi:WD40 repeat domain-containing protein [Tautonia marina]|uniref:WD40 repeat domain-containing protein n=1 Tax=Tautonia marina TaxID=2653855 RepID=UPI0013757691|nr:WD40 repeat domain-containing protein [Tautonia marina]